MNKGLLEGCILKIISEKSAYGYLIITLLTEAGFVNMKESTIYPLLVRLEKKNLISSYYEPSSIGPARKYYCITPEGTEYLKEFTDAFLETEQSVLSILKGRNSYGKEYKICDLCIVRSLSCCVDGMPVAFRAKWWLGAV